MKKKLRLLLCILILSAFSLPAANIYWVSFHDGDETPSAAALGAGFTNAPDAGYTKLLTSKGHTVTRYHTTGTPDAATLNAADLVIISRSVPSGDYQDLAEANAWNGITAPMIITGGYITRGSRLGITTGDTMVDVNTTAGIRLRVNVPSHPIFQGVNLDANNVMQNIYATRVTYTNSTTGVETLQVGISVNSSAIISGGTALAVVGTAGDAAVNGMIIGEFSQGLTTQRADQLAAKRLVFFTGSRESGITSEGSGIFDLQPDGEKLFLNAVDYMLSKAAPQVVVTPALATNLYAGDTWTFTASAFGSDPMTYKWLKNGNEIAGQTGPTLVFPSLTLADAGDYQAVVANAYGSSTSTVGRLEFAVPGPTSITSGLVSYWPLDELNGSMTFDVVSTYDMTAYKMSAANIVPGRWGNALRFDNAAGTYLGRVHNPGENLPIYQHPNFTVSLWVNGGTQSDHRVFSEGNGTNNNTLFNLGTHNAGTDGTVDIYIRSDGGTVVGDHRHSVGIAYDYMWHNIVYAQRDIGNGAMKAQLFIDGVLDSVVITPVRPLSVDRTSIGSILRSAPGAYFTGDIDEVAVWERALTQEEVQILQVTAITNAPTRPQPLVISEFRSELPAVVKGGSTKLHWAMSRDVAQVTITPIGNVTAQTQFGAGSTTATLNETTEFVLTATRGADSLSATVKVAVVEGVAPNWALLDNFDQYPEGNLTQNGVWRRADGVAQVARLNGNPAARTASGSSASFLNLNGFSVADEQRCTLFFRIIPQASEAIGITNVVGLTDKVFRNYGEAFQNVGPVLYAAAFTNDVAGVTTNAWYLGARNGWMGDNVSYPIDFAPIPLETGVVYNVWIDITNLVASAQAGGYNDEFTVYLQKDGDAARTVLFQNYLSDRDFYWTEAVLGGFMPTLDKLILTGNNATYSAMFDDFYLTHGAYNATVPRVYGYTGPDVAGSLSIGWVDNQVQIQWTSGVLQQASSITGEWTDVPGNPTSPFLVTPSAAGMFYRTR